MKNQRKKIIREGKEGREKQLNKYNKKYNKKINKTKKKKPLLSLKKNILINGKKIYIYIHIVSEKIEVTKNVITERPR